MKITNVEAAQLFRTVWEYGGFVLVFNRTVKVHRAGLVPRALIDAVERRYAEDVIRLVKATTHETEIPPASR